VPVSGTSYPTLIGVPALELGELLLDPQAAAARDKAATTSINACNRWGLRVALKAISVPGDRGQGKFK